jgi:hypothetical protein
MKTLKASLTTPEKSGAGPEGLRSDRLPNVVSKDSSESVEESAALFLDNLLVPFPLSLNFVLGRPPRPDKVIGSSFQALIPSVPTERTIEFNSPTAAPAAGLPGTVNAPYVSDWLDFGKDWTTSNVSELHANKNNSNDVGSSISDDLIVLLQAGVMAEGSAEPCKFRRWSAMEDALLKAAMEIESNNGSDFSFQTVASKYFDNVRNYHQCKSRWRKIRPDVNRSEFTVEEQIRILELHSRGVEFPSIAAQLHQRTTEQVRSFFFNKLDPSLKKKKFLPWSEEEKQILFRAQREKGNKWVAIAKLLPGRSESDVKNQWHNTKTKQRRKVRRALLSPVKMSTTPVKLSTTPIKNCADV